MIKGGVKISVKSRLATYLNLPDKMKVPAMLKKAGFQGEAASFYRRMRVYDDVEIALQVWEQDRGDLSNQLSKMLGVTGRMTIDAMLDMAGIKWCRSTLNRRLAAGMTIEEAVSEDYGISEVKAELLKHMPGDPRDTVDSILQSNGYISTYKTIHDHIRRGKSVGEAVKAATRKDIVARVLEAILEPQTWVSIKEITRDADCCVQAARNNAKYLVDNGIVAMVTHDRAKYYCDARIANGVEPVSTDRESEVTQYLKDQSKFKSVSEVGQGVGINKRWAGVLLNRMHSKGLVTRKKVTYEGKQKYLYRTKVNLNWI